MSHHHSLWAANVDSKPTSCPSLSLRSVGLKQPPGWSVSRYFLSFRFELVILPFVPSQKRTVMSALLSVIPYAFQQQSPAYCISLVVDSVCSSFSPPCSQLELVSRALTLTFWLLSLPPFFPPRQSIPNKAQRVNFAELISLLIASPNPRSRFQSSAWHRASLLPHSHPPSPTQVTPAPQKSVHLPSTEGTFPLWWLSSSTLTVLKVLPKPPSCS